MRFLVSFLQRDEEGLSCCTSSITCNRFTRSNLTVRGSRKWNLKRRMLRLARIGLARESAAVRLMVQIREALGAERTSGVVIV